VERGPEVRAAPGAGAEFLAGDSLRALAALAVMCFHRRTPPAIAPYLRNRVLRIVPGLVALTLVTLLLFGAAGTSAGGVLAVPLLGQAYFPTAFGAGLAHVWTVDAEAVFYLVLPLGFLLATRAQGTRSTPQRRRALLLAAVGVIALISLVLSGTPKPLDADAQHLFGLVAFAFAPGLALAAVEDVARPWVRRRP
jgi:peptidoglycan/LPS O-acetylase OafA/YrhL